MSTLRESVLSLDVGDPEVAIAVHALLGDDPELLSQASEPPRSYGSLGPWVKANFLSADGPFFGLAEHAPQAALGDAFDERVDRLLRLLVIRPRMEADLKALSRIEDADLEPILTVLTEAGVVRADVNPLEPDAPFWTLDHRLVRFHYAMMTEHLERWRRGYITDKLWRMTSARFNRYVCRPEFTKLAREWALGDPAAAETTRIVVPDPRFRQLRTLEVAAWSEKGELVALGTVRWGITMREKQLQRMRHVRRLLDAESVRMYCIAPRVDPAIAADEAPELFRVGPAHLLRAV
ncbi:hypothetical protein [Glycomyces buryatensis]|uniref:Uncharacterized protein n=1 Tax=Glycomyces buryatensis TaxID=2570927 RepID=A0A4S8PVW3_9ACTN|nr:hypothetical protein [Glycomyces buryatensis]THV34641.1 hypothetical protein FAB82_24170 [Glycomyces buryatensis]